MNINLIYREQTTIDDIKVETFNLVSKSVVVSERDEMYRVNLDGNQKWSFGGIEIRTPAGEVIQTYAPKIEVQRVTNIKISKLAHEFLSSIFTDTGAAPYTLIFNEETMTCERYYMLNENSFYFKGSERGSLSDIYREHMDDTDRRFQITTYSPKPYLERGEPDDITGDYGKVLPLENTIPLPCYSHRGERGTEVRLVHSLLKNKSELVIKDPVSFVDIHTGIWVSGKILAQTNLGSIDITGEISDQRDITSAVVELIDEPDRKTIEIFCIKVETVSGEEDAN